MQNLRRSGTLMAAISQSGSYTMAATPIKSLELHYTMIQFLIIIIKIIPLQERIENLIRAND